LTLKRKGEKNKDSSMTSRKLLNKTSSLTNQEIKYKPFFT